jgi:hypothetical protein
MISRRGRLTQTPYNFGKEWNARRAVSHELLWNAVPAAAWRREADLAWRRASLLRLPPFRELDHLARLFDFA